MKRKIFAKPKACYCLARDENADPQGYFKFLEDFYGGLDVFEPNKLCIDDLECAYCLLSFALELKEKGKQKYNKKQLSVLTKALNQTTKEFLDQLLARIHQFIETE